MKTDIDRLQDVLECRVNGRRCGKTTLMCHQIAAQIELGDCPEIYVIIRDYNSLQWFRRQLSEVLDEHELCLVAIGVAQDSVTDPNKIKRVIKYISACGDWNKLVGVKNADVFVDHAAWPEGFNLQWMR